VRLLRVPFSIKNLERAIDLQQRGYRLMLWLGHAIDRGSVALDQLHISMSVERSARVWIEANYAVLPNDARPAEEDLAAFTNLFASYLVTSFDLREDPPRRKVTTCSCLCPFCALMVSLSHVQPKRLQPIDKLRARRLELDYLRNAARELGNTSSEAGLNAIADDAALREPLAMATYGRELLKRLDGEYEGAEVLVLWRWFAWTRTGAPKKGFELTASAILDAELAVMGVLRDVETYGAAT
jgi:hypothetical protein